MSEPQVTQVDEPKYDLLGPEHLALKVFAGEPGGSSRFILEGINVRPGWASACNGKILVMVPTHREGKSECSLPPVTGTPIKQEVTIRIRPLEKAMSLAAKKNSKADDVRKSVVISQDGIEGSKKVMLSATDDGTEAMVKAEVMEGKYPRVEEALPSIAKTTFRVMLHPELIAPLMEYALEYGEPGSGVSFMMDPRKPDGAIRLEFDMKPGVLGPRRAVGAVMPMGKRDNLKPFVQIGVLVSAEDVIGIAEAKGTDTTEEQADAWLTSYGKEIEERLRKIAWRMMDRLFWQKKKEEKQTADAGDSGP